MSRNGSELRHSEGAVMHEENKLSYITTERNESVDNSQGSDGRPFNHLKLRQPPYKNEGRQFNLTKSLLDQHEAYQKIDPEDHVA